MKFQSPLLQEDALTSLTTTRAYVILDLREDIVTQMSMIASHLPVSTVEFNHKDVPLKQTVIN